MGGWPPPETHAVLRASSEATTMTTAHASTFACTATFQIAPGCPVAHNLRAECLFSDAPLDPHAPENAEVIEALFDALWNMGLVDATFAPVGAASR